MDHYIDIKIKPDAELREYFLLNMVYTKLHKALFTLKSTDIGVSFPNYKVKLGDVIRIHGNQTRLSELQDMNWLGDMNGYCEISEILAVPNNVKHMTVSRKQANMTQAKLRRLIKRDSITQKEAKQYKAKMLSQGMDNPYLEIDSASSGHKHRRYIQYSELYDVTVVGSFDSFGLSKQATIPWF